MSPSKPSMVQNNEEFTQGYTGYELLYRLYRHDVIGCIGMT